MAANNDILLGVARAADPAKLRTAASRLQTLSSDFAASGAAAVLGSDAAWTAEVTRAIADTSRHAAEVSAASSAPAPAAASGSASTDAAVAAGNRKKVYAQFEALLLQNMIEAMLPENASSVYGSGTAGSVWKSMLAEKVATEISRTGALGIAKQLAASELTAAHAVMPNTPKATDA